MPFIQSLKTFLAPKRKSKLTTNSTTSSKSAISTTTSIPAPIALEERKLPTIKQILIPDPPPNRTSGRFLFDGSGSLSHGLSSSSGLRSRKSGGSGASDGSKGSRYSVKSGSLRFTGVRENYGVGAGFGFGDRGTGGEERKREVVFLKRNPLLAKRNERGLRMRMKIVMDEKSYTPPPTSTPSSASSSSSYSQDSVYSKDEDLTHLPNQQEKNEIESTPSVDLAHSETLKPSTQFELLMSFHSDIRSQNHRVPFTAAQITAMEEMLSYSSTLAILGSNAIAGTGWANFDVMRRVCDDILYSGRDIPHSLPVTAVPKGSEREDEEEKEKSALEILAKDSLETSSPEPVTGLGLGPKSEAEPGSALEQEQKQPWSFFFPISSASSASPRSKPEPTQANPALVSLPRPSLRNTDINSTSNGPALTPKELLLVCNKLSVQKGISFTYKDVQRVEREIVQHVLGWRYLLRTFIHGKEELSEDMIKTTHSIVMHGISPAERSGETSSENGEGGTWEVHAGQYRSAEASSSSSSSSTHSPSPSPPSIIQRKMQELVTDFNTRISSSSLKESIDPVELAAEFSYRILRIQPFLYGNGRVARLFVNTILLHFLGVIAPFGQSSEERALYVGLMAKERLSQLKVGAQDNEDEDKEDGNGEQGEKASKRKPWAELATFLLGKCVSTIEAVWDVLEDEDVVGVDVRGGWEGVVLETDLQEGEEEEQDDCKDKIVGYDFGLEGLCEIDREKNRREKPVRWRNPPPRRRWPYMDVLESLKAPEWVAGEGENEEGQGKEGCEDEAFEAFRRKAGSLMTGTGFVVPEIVDIGPRLEGDES